ncbi:DUF2243 domain-containing protein [Cereibacter sphaeroides]|uniref:DUF2243 domain-containing protein n=1 Tax=Cereibacter sphaeroides TaxID=1063 RepID=UPI0039906A51
MASHGDECRLSAAQRREPPAQHAARQAFPHGHLSLPAGRGLVLLWRAARPPHALWPARAFLGTVLMGFGLFNLCEGTVNHQILGIHHVNETVPRSQWIWWDMAFLLWGAAMLVGGWTLWRRR